MITIPTSEEEVPRQPVYHDGARGFVCPDYFATNPKTGEKMFRSDMLGETIDIHGQTAGAYVADLYRRARLERPDLPSRCATCAFRRGTEANQSIASIGDALMAVATGDVDFRCHENIRMMSDDCDHLCRGFEAINTSSVGAKLRLMQKQEAF